MAEICLNCEKQVPKYMTQVVSLDTFPTLTEKAKQFDYSDIRVCEDCYEELSASLPTGDNSSYLHPMFRAGVNTEGETKE